MSMSPLGRQTTSEILPGSAHKHRGAVSGAPALRRESIIDFNALTAQLDGT